MIKSFFADLYQDDEGDKFGLLLPIIAFSVLIGFAALALTALFASFPFLPLLVIAGVTIAYAPIILGVAAAVVSFLFSSGILFVLSQFNKDIKPLDSQNLRELDNPENHDISPIAFTSANRFDVGSSSNNETINYPALFPQPSIQSQNIQGTPHVI
jgi:hypothetical protein